MAAETAFARRLCVDFAGRLPTGEEVQEFLADAEPGKRQRWMLRWFQSEDAGEWRFQRLADALRMTDESPGYVDWLRRAVKEDMPFDRLVMELVTAGTDERAGFLFRAVEDVESLAVESARALLGVDLHCAKCHDHPYSEVTQRQFYEYAGCWNVAFDDEGRKTLTSAPLPLRLPANYLYRDGKAGEPVEARGLPLGREGDQGKRVADRQALAEWLAVEQQERLSEVAALRVWHWMFGQPKAPVGAFVPLSADGEQTRAAACKCAPRVRADMELDFAALEREGVETRALVKVLGEELRRCEFRLGRFQAVLACTAAYGREAFVVEEGRREHLHARFFPAPLVRRLPAEVLWNALMGWADKEGEKTMHLPQILPSEHALRMLGRGGRQWADAETSAVSHELVRWMILGDNPAQAARGRLGRMAADMLFLETLGRRMSPSEAKALGHHVETGGAMEEAVWALLNTSEFLFQR